MSVVIVGSVALDDIESPAGRVTEVPGGSAIYAAFAASRFTQPRIVGVMGQDFPRKTLQDMDTLGIDRTGLVEAEGRTFRWGGRYLADWNTRDTLFTELNVFEDFHPRLPESWRRTPYVLLANIHPALQLEVLEQMEGQPYVAADTMNLWIDTALPELKELLTKVSLLIINDEEALMLTGERDYKRAVEKIWSWNGPNSIIIKKGRHGALLFSGGMYFCAPALLLDKVKDPTGAGDSFAGGVMGYLAKMNSSDFPTLRRAVVYGSIMASFCVEEFSIAGLQLADQTDIEERYRVFENISRF